MFRLYLHFTKAREGLGGATTTITGPNDTRHVIWPSVCVFILNNHFYLLYLGDIYVLHAREGMGWAVTKIMGPKDAIHVVWAIGTCLFPTPNKV